MPTAYRDAKSLKQQIFAEKKRFIHQVSWTRKADTKLKFVSSSKGLGSILRGEGKERLTYLLILIQRMNWKVLELSHLRLGIQKGWQRTKNFQSGRVWFISPMCVQIWSLHQIFLDGLLAFNGLWLVKVAFLQLQFCEFWFCCDLEIAWGLFACSLCLLTPLGPVWLAWPGALRSAVKRPVVISWNRLKTIKQLKNKTNKQKTIRMWFQY